MGQTEDTGLGIDPEYEKILEKAEKKRGKLLAERNRHSVDLPLKYWNQQAHFTTPASGTPEKAIRGLASVEKILARFEITAEELSDHTSAPLATVRRILESDNKHSPFVMVDVEDAVALTDESIQKARKGAVRCFTEEDWGPTLPFYRPGGLRLDTCIEDLLTVLPAVAKGRTPDAFPIAGIVWPKTEHPDELEWVCDLLERIEKRLGLEENQIKLEFLVESGYALNQVSKLAKACAHRLTGIIWGIADYTADTNLPRMQNDHPVCDWARAEIVNISGALNVPAIDSMTLNYPTPIHRGADLSEAQQAENKLKILNALKEVYDDAIHGIELGMTGKWVGHPLQLFMVLAAYRTAISEEQVASDLKDIEAYTESVAKGAGATVLGEGHRAYMADRATDRHLRARLRRATAWGLLDAERASALGLISDAEKSILTGA